MAEPCVRGSTPTSQVMARSCLGLRPSMRLPSRIRSRTTALFQGMEKAAETCSGVYFGSPAFGQEFRDDLALCSSRIFVGTGLLARR